MTEEAKTARTKRLWPALALAALGVVFAATGLFLLIGGIRLALLGGSPYFVTAGAGLLAAGALTALRRPLGAALYLAVFLLTIVWALIEVGFSFWPLFSWLFAPAVLAIPTLLLLPAFRYPRGAPNFRRAHLGVALLIALALAGTVFRAFQPVMLVEATNVPGPIAGKAIDAAAPGDWPAWGRTNAGTRYAPLDQITPANVANLEVAWTYRTGDVPKGGQGHVVTPLHIGGRLYGCTPTSRMFAIDAETGKELWTFDPKATGIRFPRCRGVAYFDAAAPGIGGAPALPPAARCAQRILSTTVDARLIAVDARTGQACPDFGENGQVDLTTGIGVIKPGMLFQTSAPLIARGLVIMGGRINDNQDTDVPSGVIRAFSARTGELVWAWDLGNPSITRAPPEGQTYTRSTPNVWAPPAYDDTLGLLYLPMGNSSPDFWGGTRGRIADDYSSAIVALDIATGRERWKFNTVHHDVWDYDVPAQPALYDVPDGRGGTVPALLQVTKRGQIFLLDRRTGRAIAPVEERPVPQGPPPGDWLAPTQPYSSMPSIGAEPLSESRMWGATLLDQLACRIAFRSARYEGEFTPQSTQGTVQWPGWSGGMNWGSASIAENRGYAIVNDIRVPMINRLIPRSDYAAAEEAKAEGDIFSPQANTPFGLLQKRFMSPIGVPCQEPPYGTITAIDLATRNIVWSRPLGTVEDTGPLGIPMGLSVPIGMPTLGGPITTSSGLIFMGGTQDWYIRALDLRTGKELWKGRLPVGGETTPMTYVAPQSGRQFVVISAGGNRSTDIRGDHVVAFALPRNR